MFYFILGVLTGMLFYKTDFEKVSSTLSQLADLYSTVLQKQDESFSPAMKHYHTTRQVMNFLFVTFLQKYLIYFKPHQETIKLYEGEKVLYPLSIGNKTKYIPFSTTHLQTPDVLSLSFERNNDLFSEKWLTENITSVLSVYSDMKAITPRDLGLKTLSIEVLDGIDVKKLVFSEQDQIVIN